MATIDELINKHAQRTGLDPKMIKKFIMIESGGDPSNTTGPYKGLLQLSDKEFASGGGSGSIYDPEQNIMAGTNKLAREKLQFEQKYGRTATAADLYGVHQQGAAGYAAHLANPEGTAWKNVRRYYSSDAMAKKAIWGNVPDSMKAKFGSVENVTSAGFTGMWGARVEGAPDTSTFAGRVGKSKARHEGIPSEVEARATEPTRKGSFPDEPAPEIPQFQVRSMVPNIQLARIPT